MRQLADLAVWMGMVVLAVGVIYFTPIVADYFTADPRLSIESASRGGGHRTALHVSRPVGESPPGH